jgi:hypothetical protein
MLLFIIGLAGFLMIALGFKRPYGLILLGKTIQTKTMLALGTFILTAVVLLIAFGVD